MTWPKIHRSLRRCSRQSCAAPCLGIRRNILRWQRFFLEMMNSYDWGSLLLFFYYYYYHYYYIYLFIYLFIYYLFMMLWWNIIELMVNWINWKWWNLLGLYEMMKYYWGLPLKKVQNRRGNISGWLLERPQSIGKIGIPIIDYDDDQYITRGNITPYKHHPTGP